jgi:hypothetical protein
VCRPHASGATVFNADPAGSVFTLRSPMMRALVLLALFLPLTTLAAPLENKWRLQFSGGARSAGVVALAITPKDQATINVEVPIEAGTGENAVARRVRDGLREAIGKDFKVEIDDGEDVLVKRRLGRPRFNVEVTQISAAGVRVNLDQE